MKRTLILAGVLVVAGGCRIYFVPGTPTDYVRSQARVPGRTPTSPTATWSDVRRAIWGKYYRCNEATIAYLGSLDRYDDRDVFVLLFAANWARVPVAQVVQAYEECGRQLHHVLKHYRIDPDTLYVDVPNGTPCPVPYGRAYGYYWNQHRRPRFRLSNEEIRALVELRIACHYYGYAPTEFFQTYRHLRRTHRKQPVRQLLVRDAARRGRGKLDSLGRPIPKRVGKAWREKRPEAKKGKVHKRDHDAQDEAREARQKAREEAKKRADGHRKRRKEALEEALKEAREEAWKKAKEKDDEDEKDDDDKAEKKDDDKADDKKAEKKEEEDDDDGDDG